MYHLERVFFDGMGPMRVLGIDPGLTRCGLAVVSGSTGRQLSLDQVDVVRTSSDDGLAKRLLSVDTGVQAWLAHHEPDVVAIERVFSQHNVRTVMGTAQASGVATLAAARNGLDVVEHTPSEVKAAVTGSGSADKAQVAQMVTRILRLPQQPTPADATDAIALAVCHLWRGAAQQRIAAAVAARTSGATR